MKTGMLVSAVFLAFSSTLIATPMTGALAGPIYALQDDPGSGQIAGKKHRPISHKGRASGQIACTVLGCQRIPPHCHPVPGMDWWGNPTGYDEVVCR